MAHTRQPDVPGDMDRRGLRHGRGRWRDRVRAREGGNVDCEGDAVSDHDDHSLPDWDEICRRNGYSLQNIIMGRKPQKRRWTAWGTFAVLIMLAAIYCLF
jgi:hypothetical protein